MSACGMPQYGTLECCKQKHTAAHRLEGTPFENTHQAALGRFGKDAGTAWLWGQSSPSQGCSWQGADPVRTSQRTGTTPQKKSPRSCKCCKGPDFPMFPRRRPIHRRRQDQEERGGPPLGPRRKAPRGASFGERGKAVRDRSGGGEPGG